MLPPRLRLLEPLEPRDLPSAAFQTLPIIPDNQAAVDTARAIAALGQTDGRRTNAFMDIGDSNSAEFSPYAPGYLSPLGAPGYNPVSSGLAASYPNLLGTLATFQAPLPGGVNSFDHTSVAAVPGYRAMDVLGTYGQELAITNAGVALIMIGTNDVMLETPPASFASELQSLVHGLASAGVVPILSTIPDNEDNNNIYESGVISLNQVIANVATQDNLPLWNAWLGLQSLPNRGLQTAGVHLDTAPGGGGGMTPADLQYGQNQRNLEALQVLNWYQTQVLGAPPPVAPMSSWTPIQAGEQVYAVGLGEGQAPLVSVYDVKTGKEIDSFLAFNASFTGGVRVAVADTNGDGVPDIIVGAGPGGGPEVKVFSGADGSTLANFFAFDSSFRDGVSSVAASDLTGSGKADVVVGAGPGGGPVVAVYSGGNFAPVERFFAYSPVFRGGVSVTTGTFAGVGAGIATTPGPGGGPVVEVFGFGSMTPADSFLASAAATGTSTGWAIAAADLAGTGTDQIIVGPVTGLPVVNVYDPKSQTNLANFYAGPTSNDGGTRLGVIPGTNGTPDELLVGNGPGDTVSVVGVTGMTGALNPLSPTDTTRAYGIYVG
jgi:hypothetical protein